MKRVIGSYRKGLSKEAGFMNWVQWSGRQSQGPAWTIRLSGSFHDCAGKLPKNISAAFCLREVDDIDSKEICRTLNISENNLWVMLHRARMALRRCLETNWFGKSGE